MKVDMETGGNLVIVGGDGENEYGGAVSAYEWKRKKGNSKDN